MTDGRFQGGIEMSCYAGWGTGSSMGASPEQHGPSTATPHTLQAGPWMPPTHQGCRPGGSRQRLKGRRKNLFNLWTMSPEVCSCMWARCWLQLEMGMLLPPILSRKCAPAKSDVGVWLIWNYILLQISQGPYRLKSSFGKIIYIAKNSFVKWIQVCSPLSKYTLQIQFNSTNVFLLQGIVPVQVITKIVKMWSPPLWNSYSNRGR